MKLTGIKGKTSAFLLFFLFLAGLLAVLREQHLLEAQYRTLRTREVQREITLSQDAVSQLLSRLRNAGDSVASWGATKNALRQKNASPYAQTLEDGWIPLQQLLPELGFIRLSLPNNQTLWELNGWQFTPPPQETPEIRDNQQIAIQQEHPQHLVACRQDCLLLVWVPVLADGKPVGTVMVASRLEEIMAHFRRITDSHVGLIRSTPNAAGTNITDRYSILALTGGDKPHRIIQHTQDRWLTLEESAAWWQEIDFEGQHYEIERWPLSLNQQLLPVDFWLIHDIQQDYVDQQNRLISSIAAIILIITLVGGLTFALSRHFVAKIETITHAIAAIGQRHHAQVKALLRHRPTPLFPDELDHALHTTSWVADELNNKEAESARYQRQLTRTLTDLEKERSLIRSLLDTAPLIVLVHDNHSQISLHNRFAARLLNWNHPDSPALTAFFPDPFLLPNPDQFRIDPIVRSEHQIQAADGTLRDFTWVHCVFNIPELGESILSIGEDVSALKNALQEKERLNLQLMRSQKMESIGQLAGGIAHDFNNILASMLGYTDLAYEMYAKDQNEKLAHYLSQVLKSGERAAQIISQLLAFSRNSTEEKHVLYVAPLAKEIIKLIQPLIPSTLTILSDLDPEIQVTVNPGQFQQILMNLIINARDAMPQGGKIHLQLETVQIEEEALECLSCHNKVSGEWALLTVKDQGTGIEPEILDKIFDPFFTTKEVGKGTGMGLSVVHGLIHSIHGHILVDTHLGSGTTFRIYMPIARPEAAPLTLALQD